MNLQLDHVHASLGTFDLEVDAELHGRVTAIFGASGAGKTSLIEVIAGLRRQRSGAVRLDCMTLSDTSTFVQPERRGIGYVPQDGALFPHLSVTRNLLFGFRGSAKAVPGITVQHVSEVLEIEGLLARRVTTLSGGEKQRVALGRALLAAPRLLLLDEPLAGLDVPLRERLVPYLRRVRDEFGIPMLYISHSPDEVMALCDDVLVLDRGKVVMRGSPAEVFTAAQTTRYTLRKKEP